MNSDLSSKNALVIDSGLFLPFARTLARHFAKVLYHVPIYSPFPKITEAIIGDGFDEITVERDFWAGVNAADIIVFPDIGHGSLQDHLEAQGKRVWGSRMAEKLETDRAFLKHFQEQNDMFVPTYAFCGGFSDLRGHLHAYPDMYVKISKYRGTTETFHSINGQMSLPWMDDLRTKLGPLHDDVNFIVEHALPSVIELGFDGFCIDGVMPDFAVQGIEAKDKGYVGCVLQQNAMEPALLRVVHALSDYLEKQRYRNFFSAEVHITEDGKGYLTDPCCRHASPAGECLDELYQNLGEIIWEGAHGEFVEPHYSHSFAVQALIEHPGSKEGWRCLEVPAEVSQWVKIGSCCRVDDSDRLWIPPLPWSDPIIGSVIALADTLEEAIATLKEHAAALDGQCLVVHTEAVADILANMREAEDADVQISEERIPPPETVIKES